MCGRYTLTAQEDDIQRQFGLEVPIPEFEPRYNIAPGQKVLAIIDDGKQRRGGFMYWGLVPSWAKDPKIGYKMINARSETAHEKPSFKNLMAAKRCLILADSFYEWKKEDKDKIPFRIMPKNREVFAFAGLWDHWKTQEEERFTCTILTKEANEFMEDIHHRMPVILPKERQNHWIEPVQWQPGDAAQFIEQLTIDDLYAEQVSTYVNSAKNEGPECIQPIT
ncbi:putative SOS response-associated peptidase YoqW [Halobacillus andaensis]|uniref:Abasic site processing protein n=1 Tax=Halobacillus andaensis TaxID=1176239 RepID=A0A917EW31_HALAA|nr:SOS response-associated peptidase [Halobacillus andaensis]MBP2005943.1 putative SOS response-associated peptidase YedK [Halobacillus andaensis]GGF24823.1 putative SOS response-associated peptidase YoqW [Halobacillus andaensis]